ncbi:MAG TPA: thioredoxin family protein [Xanthobacteraceae bacterium]|nr:thioredoxin family protein [Xanthobacteraceae bacterium]
MPSRRFLLTAAVAAGAIWLAPAFAAERHPFDAKAFADAQRSGKPIFVAIHAPWCPTCKAQAPILSELLTDPKFKNLVYFIIDFDNQKDAVRHLGARTQSTLIAFKGDREVGRSAGDTSRASIAALLAKTL